MPYTLNGYRMMQPVVRVSRTSRLCCNCGAPRSRPPALPSDAGAPNVTSTCSLGGLVRGRHVAVLWDLDNVHFYSPLSTAPLQVHRVLVG